MPRLTQPLPRIEACARVSRARLDLPYRWRGIESARRRLIRRDNFPLIALAGVVVGMTVLLGRIAVTNNYVFPDEANAILFGRSIADDASLAYSGDIARGPERLSSLVTALIATATESTSQQLWALHAVMALFQGLVAVPAWLAGRKLGLGRWAAVVAAAIAASGSFAFYGIFTLNQSIGLLCATTMLWAMVRALRRPGVASDLLVLAALAATALARIGWAPLVVALAPGALATAWFERPSGERLAAWLRALPARLARRHPVLLPAFVIGALAAIVFGPSTFLGGEMYGGVRLKPHLELETLWDNARLLLSHLALDLALVPFILAVPVLLRDLVRPGDATSGGFAWIVLGLLVVFSYAYYGSMNEDRYLAVLAPPFALAGTLAVFRRPAPVWAVVISGLLSAGLVATSYGWPQQGPFDFFVAPTSLFFERVVVGNLALRSPITTADAPTLALLGGAGAALVVAVVARKPQLRRPLALAAASVVLVGVLVFQAAAAEYPARKFVEAVGMPEVSAEETSFIDRIARGRRVEPLAVDDSVDPDLDVQLPLLRVHNRTLGAGIAVMRAPPPPGRPAPRVPNVRLDWRSGEAQVTGAVPHFLLQKPGFQAVGFAGRVLPPSPSYSFAQLKRIRRPLRTLWIVRGDSVQGYPARGDALRLRIFPPTAKSVCVRGGIAVHALSDRSSRYALSGAPRTLRGVGEPGASKPFVARLYGGQPTTLVLRGTPGRLPDGTWVGPTFTELRVAACGREKRRN